MIRRLTAFLMLSRRELMLVLLLFAASLPAVTARLYSSDEVEYFSYLRSLWFDRDVSFENEYHYFYDHRIAQSADFHHTFLELETPAGRRINYGTIGCAMLWSPFYAAADICPRTARAAGHQSRRMAIRSPTWRRSRTGSAFYGFATIACSHRARRGGSSARARSAPGSRCGLGTPLLFYMYIAPPFSHACSAFAVALFVTIWLHVRDRGASAGTVALGLTRRADGDGARTGRLFTLGPGVDFAWSRRRDPGEQARSSVRGVTGSPPALAGCAAFAGSATCRSCSPTRRSTAGPGPRRSSPARCTGRRRTRSRCCGSRSTAFSSGRRSPCSRLAGLRDGVSSMPRRRRHRPTRVSARACC